MCHFETATSEPSLGYAPALRFVSELVSRAGSSCLPPAPHAVFQLANARTLTAPPRPPPEHMLTEKTARPLDAVLWPPYMDVREDTYTVQCAGHWQTRRTLFGPVATPDVATVPLPLKRV